MKYAGLVFSKNDCLTNIDLCNINDMVNGTYSTKKLCMLSTFAATKLILIHSSFIHSAYDKKWKYSIILVVQELRLENIHYMTLNNFHLNFVHYNLVSKCSDPLHQAHQGVGYSIWDSPLIADKHCEMKQGKIFL